MNRSRRMKTLPKFSSVHAAFYNYLDQKRHLTSRETSKAHAQPLWPSGAL